MIQEKHVYSSPEVTTFEIRLKGTILTISGGDPGAAGNDLLYGNNYGFGDDD